MSLYPQWLQPFFLLEVTQSDFVFHASFDLFFHWIILLWLPMDRNLTICIIFACRYQCYLARQEPASQINMTVKQSPLISWIFFFFHKLANWVKRNSSKSGSSKRENYNGSRGPRRYQQTHTKPLATCILVVPLHVKPLIFFCFPCFTPSSAVLPFSICHSSTSKVPLVWPFVFGLH